MSSVKITPRLRLLINRSIEVKWEAFIKKGIELRLDQEEFEEYHYDRNEFSFNFEDFKLVMSLDLEKWHDEECQLDDYIHLEDECKCKKDIGYEVSLKYNKTILIKFNVDKNTAREDMKELFEILKGEYYFCPCEKIADHTDTTTGKMWCDECYIYRMNHPNGMSEVCAICHEDEGRYIKTSCGHYFHHHCFMKIENGRSENYTLLRKCPLCRQFSDYTYFCGI